MDNQHRQIKGYRELSQEEINLMNRIKELGPQIEAVVTELNGMGSAIDQRWAAIGKTHLQEGLMALTRSVAQPTFF